MALNIENEMILTVQSIWKYFWSNVSLIIGNISCCNTTTHMLYDAERLVQLFFIHFTINNLLLSYCNFIWIIHWYLFSYTNVKSITCNHLSSKHTYHYIFCLPFSFIKCVSWKCFFPKSAQGVLIITYISFPTERE